MLVSINAILSNAGYIELSIDENKLLKISVIVSIIEFEAKFKAKPPKII